MNKKTGEELKSQGLLVYLTVIDFGVALLAGLLSGARVVHCIAAQAADERQAAAKGRFHVIVLGEVGVYMQSLTDLEQFSRQFPQQNEQQWTMTKALLKARKLKDLPECCR